MYADCDDMFSTDQCLELQLEEDEFPEDVTFPSSKFVCAKCNRSFTTNQNLKRHVGSRVCQRHPKVIPDFTCSNCNRVFATDQNLKEHSERQICSRNTTPNVKVFRCSNCNNTFATNQSLQRHVDNEICSKPLQDRISTPRVFICQNCSCTFTSSQSLQRHIDNQICRKDSIYPRSGNFVKKRRLETLFGNSLTNASKDTVLKKQQPVNQNSTIKFIIDDSHTDASEDTIHEPNEMAMVEAILDDGHTDILEDSVQELQHAANENSKTGNISSDSHADASEDTIEQRLPLLQPHLETDLSDDSITIEDNVLEIQNTGKHNSVTVWIKEEEEGCENEFAGSTAIDNIDDLFRKCKNIEFPDTRWCYSMIANNILITNWSPSFDCLKKIIIDPNLKITAFVKDVGIIIDETEVYDLNIVKDIVKKLHEIKECAYNPTKSSRMKCRGFVKQDKEYCSSCSGELEKDRIFKKRID